MNIGTAIRVSLAKRNKSQSWLAQKLGVTRPYISNLCNNKKSPSIRTLVTIAEALDFSVSTLIKGGE